MCRDYRIKLINNSSNYNDWEGGLIIVRSMANTSR